jgi:hypothetical protein
MGAPGGVTVAGAHALVTGANRGLGKAFVAELLPSDLTSLYPDIQKQWDANDWPWKN